MAPSIGHVLSAALGWEFSDELAASAVHPGALTTKTASGAFTVTSGVVASLMLAGVTTVTRISAGRYRVTFATAQADLNYRVLTDGRDGTNTTATRVYAKTLTYFEIMVTSLTLVLITPADPAEVFFDVERKS